MTNITNVFLFSKGHHAEKVQVYGAFLPLYVYFFMVLNISLEIQYGVFFTKQTRKYVLRFYIIPKKIFFSFIFEPNNSIFKIKKKCFMISKS